MILNKVYECRVVLLACALLISCIRLLNGQADSVLRVQDLISRHDLDEARTLLSQALAEYPRDGGLLNLRGVIHAQSNEFAEAREDFARAVSLAPDLLPAWQNWARACQVDGKDCAADAWKGVLVRHPSDEEATRGLALAYERKGQYQESLRLMSKLPGGTSDLMIRCLDYSGLKLNSAAWAEAKKLAAKDDFEEGDLEAIAQSLTPQSTILLAEGLNNRSALKPSGLKLLAIAYENVKRLPDARKTLERLALAEPDNAAHLLELAHIAEKQKDYEGALGYLGHARELTPSDAQVHFLFGVVAAEMNLPVEARQSFTKALEIAPQNAEYNYAMGTVILSTRDAGSAVPYFQKYIAAKPSDAQGIYALGIAEYASGDYDAAQKDMTQVVKDPAVGGGAEYFLGRIERINGDLNLASAHLETAIHLLPKFAEAHTELARVLLTEQKDSAARTELNLALHLDPNSFQANAQLLVLYKRTHDQRAIEQEALLKKLDEDRSRRAELMLRTVEIRP